MVSTFITLDNLLLKDNWHAYRYIDFWNVAEILAC